MTEQTAEQAVPEAQKSYSPEVVEILDRIEKFTVLQMKELKEAYEERFGVTAAVAAGPMMAMPAGGGEAEGEKEEKAIFDVVIDSVGEKKIQVIKAVRQVNTTLALKEAKDFVDSIESAPKAVKEGVSKEEAEKVKELLEGAGATVSIK